MDYTGKHTIVTGITDEYKINAQNPKFFAKFINDDLRCYANTEAEAIEQLKKTFAAYKEKGKLYSPLFNKVLNTYVSTEKFDKHFTSGLSAGFFELIGEDENLYLDDETTIEDLALIAEQIQIIRNKYQLDIKPDDSVVNVLERIHESRT